MPDVYRRDRHIRAAGEVARHRDPFAETRHGRLRATKAQEAAQVRLAPALSKPTRVTEPAFPRFIRKSSLAPRTVAYPKLTGPQVSHPTIVGPTLGTALVWQCCPGLARLAGRIWIHVLARRTSKQLCAQAFVIWRRSSQGTSA